MKNSQYKTQSCEKSIQHNSIEFEYLNLKKNGVTISDDGQWFDEMTTSRRLLHWRAKSWLVGRVHYDVATCCHQLSRIIYVRFSRKWRCQSSPTAAWHEHGKRLCHSSLQSNQNQHKKTPRKVSQHGPLERWRSGPLKVDYSHFMFLIDCLSLKINWRSSKKKANFPEIYLRDV